ncbi:MAG: UbiA prenyltransferase family-domain-containing protein [Monoraphidium minutum]|nr:MAG: UbiA prenyltransferase family-domain-containing protein [Monoraphidium minutum]
MRRPSAADQNRELLGSGAARPQKRSQQQRQWRAAASAQAGGQFEEGSSALGGWASQAAAQVDAFYRFTRPHTMLGTAISIGSISCLAAGPWPWPAAAGAALGQALVSALLMNVAIVGINQLYDIDIDKVNKPYLPLASGEWSPAAGAAVVAATAAASLAVGAASGSAPLLWTLAASLALGVLYSADLPLMRWKRSPLLAAGCILAVRAVFVQLGFYTHMAAALGAPALAASRPLGFITFFMLLFSVVIALFKDIPDVAGDAAAGLRTLSVRLGEKRVFWACVGLLLALYGAGVAFGLTAPPPPPGAPAWRGAVAKWGVAAGHAVLGGLLLRRAARVDTAQHGHITSFYMFVWALLYSEYLLVPFMA